MAYYLITRNLPCSPTVLLFPFTTRKLSSEKLSNLSSATQERQNQDSNLGTGLQSARFSHFTRLPLGNTARLRQNTLKLP